MPGTAESDGGARSSVNVVRSKFVFQKKAEEVFRPAVRLQGRAVAERAGVPGCDRVLRQRARVSGTRVERGWQAKDTKHQEPLCQP